MEVIESDVLVASIPPGPSFEDTRFITLDAERAAAMLAKIIVHTVAGSKKRRREDRRGSQPCYEYARTGVCNYGPSCRYGHENLKATPDDAGKVAMRKLATLRAANFTAGAGVEVGAGAGAGVGAGDASDEIAAAASTTMTTDNNTEPEMRLPATAAAAVSSRDMEIIVPSTGVNSDASATTITSALVVVNPPEVVALVGLAALVGPTVTPLSMVARFYTRLFSPGQDAARCSEDQYVHLQANRIAIVGLAPAHPLLRLHLVVKSVVFNAALVGGPALTGKHKHGALWVEADTVIATATTEDGRSWPLRAGVRANLLELNSRLEAEPWLLTAKAPTAGFLAVVNMQLKRVLEVTAGLLGEEDYAQLCGARGLPGPRN
jgi:hypothetical protein